MNSTWWDLALSLRPPSFTIMTSSQRRTKCLASILLRKTRTRSYQSQLASRIHLLECLVLLSSLFPLKTSSLEIAVYSFSIQITILRSWELKLHDLSINTQLRSQDVLAMDQVLLFRLLLPLSHFYLRISQKIKSASLQNTLTSKLTSSKLVSRSSFLPDRISRN